MAEDSTDDAAMEVAAGVFVGGGLVSVGLGEIETLLAVPDSPCRPASGCEELPQAAAAPSRMASVKKGTAHFRVKADDVLIWNTSLTIGNQ